LLFPLFGGSLRIVLIIFFGVFSYLVIFLSGYFFFLPEEDRFFNGKNLPHSKVKEKTEKSTLKNPGKEPPPK